LLPKYRGAAPINWAIINGEKETGVTTFFLKRQVDTGAIILQRTIPIGPETTAGELHDEMMIVGAEAVAETVRMIESGEALPTPQRDEEATPAPKIFRDDCCIDWSLPAATLHDFIRGLSPHPGAFTSLDGKVIKIYRATLGDSATELKPGEILVERGNLLVGTGTTALLVREVQQGGRRAMAVDEFLRGYTFHVGARFE
jgi:methionyl-tRNA formyltransferase